MNAQSISLCLIVYGVLLFLLGALGYASNPKTAISALIAGTVSSLFALTCGVLARSGKRWPLIAALVTTLLGLVAFGMRAVKAVNAVREGMSEKQMAAILTSAMTLASLVVLIL